MICIFGFTQQNTSVKLVDVSLDYGIDRETSGTPILIWI